MSAVNWTSIKDAIYSWIATSTSLPSERILFGGQNAVRPKGVTQAWISIWVMGDEDVGNPTVVYIDNPTPTAGAEIIKEARNQRLVTMQVTCYGPKDATDTTEAYAYLSNLIAELDLTEVTDPMWDAGIGIQQTSAVITTGGTINTTRIEPRAVVSIMFLTPTVVSRTMTYIQHVNATVERTDVTPVKDFNFVFDL